MNMIEKQLKPLGWSQSILIFLITATVLRVTHYVFAPWYTTTTENPYLIGYLIGWVTTMFFFFVASFIVYKSESHPFTFDSFISRYRLQRMEKADWYWIIAMIGFAIITLTAFSFTQRLLIGLPFFSPHPSFPPDMVDMANQLTPGTLFGMSLQGKWWIVMVYLIGWLLNIFGEEFWYRGWMLPRQEVSFGKYAWIINGLMFNFQHTFQPWNMVAMLPGSLFVSYAVQRRKKTQMSLIWHGLLNISLFIFIIIGVIK